MASQSARPDTVGAPHMYAHPVAQPTTTARPTTIDAQEAAHFGAMAGDWWNPKGSSAMLHRLNPPRLAFIRAQIDSHWGGDPRARRPLTGKRVLDIGCGAGLLAEPLARLGGDVTGVDAAAENVAVARAHAESVGLAIRYRQGGSESLGAETFDLVTALEVIEHVADPAAFIADLAAALAPGGLMILSTPNRTARSRLMMITLAEGMGAIPRGTHDWARFLTPEDLSALLAEAGLREVARRGLAFHPVRGMTLSDDLGLDYLMAVVAR